VSASEREGSQRARDTRRAGRLAPAPSRLSDGWAGGWAHRRRPDAVLSGRLSDEWTRPLRRRPDAVLLAVLATTALGILLGYLSKAPCTGPTFDQFGISANLGLHKYDKLCYSDVQQLWVGRGVREHTFPYLQGKLVDDPNQPPGNLVGGAVEYPVVTGVFMWFAGLFAGDDADYLRVTALLLAPFGLLTAGMLATLSGRRAFIWAAAPALVLYSVHNWDFLATATVVGAVLAWSRGRPGLAAALLGLGAATKIYPGFFALPLLLERAYARDVRGAARVVAGTAGVWLLINLPFLLANPDGWWATYAFQARRAADLTTNSIWFWGLPDLGPSTVDHWSFALIALAWLVAVGAGWVLAGRTGGYPWLQVSAAMLAAFLLFNKVYSPQYVLWLLPFFVLLRVRWGWWAAYLAVDVLLYVGLFRWYYDITRGGDFGVAKQAAVLGVWGKAVLLALLYVVFLLSSSSIRSGPPAPVNTSGPRSSARSSTPPAGSSSLAPPGRSGARTMSSSGRSTSRTTSAASASTAASRSSTAPKNQV
jgi:Glycosyltransferase family 87